MYSVLYFVQAIILFNQIENGQPRPDEQHEKIKELVHLNTSHSADKNHVNCSSETRCTCIRAEEGGVKAVCSGLYLTEIPDFNGDVTVIDLSGNSIQFFPKSSKFPKDLTTLVLSNNILMNFKNDPFRGLFRLVRLDLSHNWFGYSPRVFKAGIFEDLKSLQQLNVKGNFRWSKRSRVYPIAITRLSSLRDLQIDGVENTRFPKEYSKLTHLKSLDLSAVVNLYPRRISCNLSTIRQTFFVNVPYVKHLNISRCNIASIEKGSFQHLPRLITLDISYNYAMSFKVFRNLTSDLRFTNIRNLNLAGIHCETGIGTMINVHDMEFLSNSSLSELNLSSNRIEMFDGGALKYLPKSLRVLDLSWNNIHYSSLVPALKMIAELYNLERLFIGFQMSILFDKSEQFWKFYARKRIMLRNAARIPKAVQLIPKTDKKLITPWMRDVENDLSNVLANDSQNRLVDYEHNCTDITANDFFIQIINFPASLRVVDLESNYFTSLNDIIVINSTNLQHLDLASNSITVIPSDFFHYLPGLRQLHLENNIIGVSISCDVDGVYFKNLNQLAYLNLANNGIEYMPSKIFQGLSRLRVLILKFNSLSDLGAEIGHMSQLKLLDMSHNMLQSLDQNSRAAIERISRTSAIQVDLTGNTLTCDCDNLGFLKWMYDHKALFKHFEANVCYFMKLSTVKFRNIDKTIVNLERSCSSYMDLMVGLIAAILFFIFLIGGAILYRHRWKLRYLYFMTKKRYKPIEQSSYDFDIFVSYADEDRQFVREELLEQMEDKFGLKICLHGRDFIAGMPIAENITDAIHRSKKTAVILTTNFIRSKWCMFEFNMARMEGLYSRGDEPTIFIVLLENIKSRDLPLMMMDVIDTDSYIKVPKTKNSEFWDNFHKAVTI